MKKLVLSVAVIAAVLATQSCKKKKADAATTAVAPTATISGTVYAETDFTNAKIEKATGATVYLLVDTKDLALNPSTTTSYATKVYKTTVDGSGKYTFTNFPVGPKAMNVTVKLGDWETTRTLSATSTDVHVFIGAQAIIINAFENGAFIQDFTY